MLPLLVFIVAGIVGYFFSTTWLIVIGVVLIGFMILLLPSTKGGLESLMPLAIVLIAGIIVVGLAIGHFVSEPPEFINKIPPILKQQKKDNVTSNNNLAETLKQLEAAGVITINNKQKEKRSKGGK